MKSIINLIISETDSSTVFVFPSEAAAVSCRKEYLRRRGLRAVRNDRFISWDRFKEHITLHNRTERPCNSVIRRLFSTDIVRRNSGSQLFSRLIPAEYRSQASGFTDSIMRVLPELEKLVGALDGAGPVLDEAAAADYRLLFHEYTAFMKKNGFFEPSWELPELSGVSSRWCIVCPEIIEDYSELEPLLSKAGCRSFSAGELSGSVLRQFENTVIETDAVINEIAGLLDGGVRFSEIAVTAADEETADALCSKARLLGISMNRRSGRPLSEYPAGRLPELLRNCRNSGFSLDAMKNLLLNRAFIWKEAETAAELIRFGIENRCLKNTSSAPEGDVWGRRLFSIRTGNPENSQRMSAFYRRLRAGIESVCRSGSLDVLAREFQIFISSFLETGPEIWPADCEQVFQRCREVLSSLRETAENLEGIEIRDPLGLWIDLLSGKIYVRQQEGSGIPVYPYRVSALINPEYHFIIGLSHDASSAVSGAFQFLTEQQRRGLDAPEHNMTAAFINAYARSGRNVRFSCSSETVSGTALPPGYFIEREAVQPVRITESDDVLLTEPVIGEQLWWRRACLSVGGRSEAGKLPPLSAFQLEGFRYAEESFMTGREFDASETVFPAAIVENDLLTKLCDAETGYFRVSATALDRWSACPFNFLLASALEVSEDEYILRTEEPWTAGSIMHDILFDFFSGIKDSGELFSISGCAEIYTERMQKSAAAVFEKWEKHDNYFYGPAWDSLKRRALADLLLFPAAEAEFYDGMKPLMLEDWLGFNMDDEQIRLLGRVDRVSAGDSGAVIIDYKRSWEKLTRTRFIRNDENGELQPPDKGYQLPLYIILAVQNNLEVAGTSYYGISQARHFPVTGTGGVLTDEDTERLCNLTMDAVRRMAESCREGDFTAPDRCDGCGYRAVCRKRYNVRWTN